MTNRADLHHAIFDAIDSGQTVPCVGDDRWLSTDSDSIGQAMKACRDCPVLTLCRKYSDKAGECAGVWAGKRRGPAGTATYASRGLTPSQKVEVDDLLAAGATSPGIARQLGLTLNQVNNRRYYPDGKPRKKQ